MKKKRDQKNNPPLWIVLAVIGIVALAALYWYQQSQQSLPTFEKYDPKERLKQKYNPHRETYGTTPDGIPVTDAFKELPPLPENFYIIQYQQMENGDIDYCTIGPEYYEQPEFVAINPPFIRVAGKYWTEPDPDHIADQGKGGFKQFQLVHAYPRDDPRGYTEGRVCAFLWSGFGIWKYMGAKADIQFMPKGVQVFPDGGCTAYNATLLTPTLQKAFSVRVSPEEFLINPNYPVFKKGWLKRIELTFNISNQVPPGTYAVGVDLVPPKRETNSNYSQVLRENGQMYVVPSQMFQTVICGVSTPPIQVQVVVH